MIRNRRALLVTLFSLLLVVGAGTPTLGSLASGSGGGLAALPPGVSWADGGPAEPATGGSAPAIRELKELQQEGVTGEGVRVGVLGGSFRTDAITSSVAARKGFGDGRPAWQHDTSVARVVSATSPDADLYLAGLGSHPSPEQYAAAVRWLLDHDVDVIVDSASYFPPAADGVSRMNRVASDATEQGVVFVTSAGNYADRHWRDTVADPGWVTFGNDSQANFLGDGAVSGRVSVRLYWEGDADFDLFLYRYREGGQDPVVARSTASQDGGGRHAEAIDATLPNGRYYVSIHAPGSVTEPTSLDLFAAHHRLTYRTENGSMVSPATVPAVISVGASDGRASTAGYSSRGRTLDLAAPGSVDVGDAELTGTSAAAPLVAGTVAMMESRNGDLTPREAQRILRSTATVTDGVHTLDPGAAVRAAKRSSRDVGRSNRTRNETAGAAPMAGGSPIKKSSS